MGLRKPEVLHSFLEGERQRLRSIMAQCEAERGTSLGYGNHMADDASEAYEQAKDLALRQNAERVLKQVEAALMRFEQGTYGLCERCGTQIDPARIKALPYVTLCLHCQQRLNA